MAFFVPYERKPGRPRPAARRLRSRSRFNPASVRRAESHFSYIDIQYLLAGTENIGVARAHPDQKITEDFAEQRDVVFYQTILKESVITLMPGMFALFFPHDIHRPCCAPGEPATIRKAVIKIHRDLFTA